MVKRLQPFVVVDECDPESIVEIGRKMVGDCLKDSFRNTCFLSHSIRMTCCLPLKARTASVTSSM